MPSLFVLERLVDAFEVGLLSFEIAMPYCSPVAILDDVQIEKELASMYLATGEVDDRWRCNLTGQGNSSKSRCHVVVGTHVALGRFSVMPPVVTRWCHSDGTTFFGGVVQVSSVSVEPFRATMTGLESRWGSGESTDSSRSSVMVMAAMETSALPPCLMRGTRVSNFWLGRYSH